MTGTQEIEDYRKSFGVRNLEEIIKQEIYEVRELTSVLGDIHQLIQKLMKEKKLLKVQVEEDMVVKANIEKAIITQKEVPTELLLTKI